MPAENANYEAVLADLQERRDQIDAAIAAIRLIMGTGSPAPIATNGVQKIASVGEIPHDAFLGLNTADAAIKYLEMVRMAQSNAQIHQALQAGGLDVTYNAVQLALSRREERVGDVINRGGKWKLAEWQPGIARRPKPTSTKPQKKKKSAARPAAGGGITLLGGTEEILRKNGSPLHADEILKRLADMGKVTNKSNLTSTLRQDTKKRFKNRGNNLWALAEWAEQSSEGKA
jgi:hypothetical protein